MNKKNASDLKKEAGNGYEKIPTFSELKTAILAMDDCTEAEIKELQDMGFINQAQLEELIGVINDRNGRKDFKTVPYDNFGYNGMQGPLSQAQIIARVDGRRKKSAGVLNKNCQLKVEKEYITAYYIEAQDEQGRFIDTANISNEELKKFNGFQNGTDTYFLNSEDANNAAKYLIAKNKAQG